MGTFKQAYYTLNAAQTRAICEAAFGVACYVGTVSAGQFDGRHVGICRDWDEAERWLRGDDVPLTDVYGDNEPHADAGRAR